ncbi:MAG: KEOPS complex N(6)-L-threonylcarbamoyladenine synthase Kae1 [archaeon]
MSLILGIESTAHTLGVAAFDSGKNRLLANEKDTFIPPIGAGMIPRDVADHHSEKVGELLGRAFRKAGKGKIDYVAYSRGPGLGPVLRVGLAIARTVSANLGVPLVPVNHPVAHIEIGKWAAQARDPVVLYVSGGNTQVIALAGGKYRVFGETLDIPIGNALDVFARDQNLPFPGGPEIERLARAGKKLIELPYVVKGMDLSYSGLLTHCRKLARSGKHSLEDICYSFQEHCFAMLVEVTERAVAHTGKREVLITGGVAANRRLAEMLEIMCRERGAEFKIVPMEFAGDNGAMIAVTGALMSGRTIPLKKADIDPRFRVDEQEVYWK